MTAVWQRHPIRAVVVAAVRQRQEATAQPQTAVLVVLVTM
jgi:hypothetical protein